MRATEIEAEREAALEIAGGGLEIDPEIAHQAEIEALTLKESRNLSRIMISIQIALTDSARPILARKGWSWTEET